MEWKWVTEMKILFYNYQHRNGCGNFLKIMYWNGKGKEEAQVLTDTGWAAITYPHRLSNIFPAQGLLRNLYDSSTGGRSSLYTLCCHLYIGTSHKGLYCHRTCHCYCTAFPCECTLPKHTNVILQLLSLHAATTVHLQVGVQLLCHGDTIVDPRLVAIDIVASWKRSLCSWILSFKTLLFKTF